MRNGWVCIDSERYSILIFLIYYFGERPKLLPYTNFYFDYDDGDDRDINEAEDDDLERDPNLLKRLDMFGRLTASSAGGW